MPLDQTYLKINVKTQIKLYNTIVVLLFKKESGLDYRGFLRQEIRKSIGFSKKFLTRISQYTDEDMDLLCKSFIKGFDHES